MAKFIYRMENILNLQTKLESEAKIRLTLANNILRQEQQKLAQIYKDIETYEDKIRSFGLTVIDVQELKRCNDAIALKKMMAAEQEKSVDRAKKNADKEMHKVREAMQKRKTQETLKEKAFEEFKREVNEEEKKEIDQVVSYQYNNGKTEEGDL